MLRVRTIRMTDYEWEMLKELARPNESRSEVVRKLIQTWIRQRKDEDLNTEKLASDDAVHEWRHRMQLPPEPGSPYSDTDTPGGTPDTLGG